MSKWGKIMIIYGAIVGISLFACLAGSIGFGMFFMLTYPGSWIRFTALIFTMIPLTYFTKKYWEVV